MSAVLTIHLLFFVACRLVTGVTIDEIQCDLYNCRNVCSTNPMDHLVSLDVSSDCSDSDNVTIIPPSNLDNRTFYRVDINNSCIRRFPRDLCDYPIVSIRITHSSLTAIPDLSCLPHLAELDLSYNEIRRLQDGIFKGLGKLQNIDLRHNVISSIGHEVFTEDLKQLLFVHLDWNNLSTVEASWPMAIRQPYCIFNLSNNRITHFSNEAGWTIDAAQKYGPAWLDLTNNQFSTWVTNQLKAYRISPLSELGLLLRWVFDLRLNPWICDCAFYKFLKIAENFPDIRKKEFFNLKCNSPAHLKGTLVLDLPLKAFICNITQNCPRSCKCQSQPFKGLGFVNVNCTKRGLSELPQVLPEGTVELLLSDNFIQILDHRPYLERLNGFDISRNNLSFITAEAVNALKPTQVKLNISGNKLKYLPIRIRDFQNVTISDNPLMCACNSTWMIEWLELDPFPMEMSVIQCTLPDSGERIKVTDADSSALGCSQTITIILSVVLGCLILAVIVITIIYCVFKYEIRLILNGRSNKSMNMDDFINDVYVCVNEEEEFDRRWVIETLLPVLERKHRLQVYFPPRDMVPGSVVADESIKEIKRSRAVLVVLTQNYLENTPKAFEFSTIYNVVVKPNKGNVIIIKFPRINLKCSRKLKAFITLKRYIDADDRKLCMKIVNAVQSENQITNASTLVVTRL